MSKEEILGVSFYPHECEGMIECATRQDALKAMDEYAKQEAIEFAKFLDDLKINADKHFNTPKSATTDELYNSYNKQK